MNRSSRIAGKSGTALKPLSGWPSYLSAISFLVVTGSAMAQFTPTGAGPYDYYDTAHWVDGIVNGEFPNAPTGASLLIDVTDLGQALADQSFTWGRNANIDLILRAIPYTSVVTGTAITGGNTITAAGHGFSDGDLIVVNTSYGTNYQIGRAGSEWYVTGATADTFQLSTVPGGTPFALTNVASPASPFEFGKLRSVELSGTISYVRGVGGSRNSVVVGRGGSDAVSAGLAVTLTDDLAVHVDQGGFGGNTTAEFRFMNSIHGNHGITKSGDATLVLGGSGNGPVAAGSFTSGVDVQEGSLSFVSNSRIDENGRVSGPAGSGTITMGNATTLLATGSNQALHNTFLIGSDVTFYRPTTGSETKDLAGALTGTEGLTLSAVAAVNTAAGFRFSGNSANTLSGTITVDNLTLNVTKSNDVRAMGAGTLHLLGGATLAAGNNHQNFGTDVTLNVDGTSRVGFGNNARRQTFGTLLMNSANETPISMTHGSAWIALGDNSGMGTSAGTGVHLRNGGVLGGGERLNVLLFVNQAGGRFAPGANGDGTVGTLTLAGGMSQTAPATFSFDLGGAAGAHDELKFAGGAVTFTAGNLIDLADLGASTIVPGTWTTLIDTTGTTSLSGFELANFAAGTFAETLGSPALQIVGSGNDKKLQVTFLPSGTLILVR